MVNIMVSVKQKKEILRLMRRIKEAYDEDMGEDEIISRTQELYRYLLQEGMALPP